MYVPEAFAETRLPVLQDAIRACGLPILISVTAAGPVATHLPLMLDADEGEFGTLYGHVARANPQWRDALADVPALVIFPGPDGYVSPSWYAAKAEHGRVVPTWNYVTVHASGQPVFFDDPERLHALVRRLTERHEAGRAAAWAVSDAPEPYVARELRAIVGLRLPIGTLQGKWKLGQNRSAADQKGLLAGYEAEAGADYAALAAVTRAVQAGIV